MINSLCVHKKIAQSPAILTYFYSKRGQIIATALLFSIYNQTLGRVQVSEIRWWKLG